MCSSRKSWKSGSFLMALMACGSRLVFPLLLLVALLMATANPAQAAKILCSRPPSTVPTEAVQKKNPPSQTTATIGVPFTYTVTAPLLGNVDSSGSFNITQSADNVAVTNVVVADDLTMTGASLTYVTNTAYLVNTSTGARTPMPTPNSTRGAANNPPARSIIVTIAFFISLPSLHPSICKACTKPQTLANRGLRTSPRASLVVPHRRRGAVQPPAAAHVR